MRSHLVSLIGVLGVSFVLGACTRDDSGRQPEVSEALSRDSSVARAGAPDAGLIEQGRLIAERECAGCHALGSSSEPGGRPDAPSMEALLGRYDDAALVNHLVDGVKLGHEDMPLFDFNVIAADALIAYLKSLRQESTGEGATPH